MAIDWGRRGPKKHRAFVWIDTEKAARKYLKQIKKKRVAAVDTEFVTQGPNEGKVIVWSISTGHGSRYVVDGKLLTKDSAFGKWLSDPYYRFVWFNYKADANIVEAHCGINLDNTFWADAMVMDWLVDETDKRHNLKHAGEKWLGWRRAGGYGDVFCYVPKGKKKSIVVSPDVLMEGPLPEEMLEEMSHKAWIVLFKHYAADDAEETFGLYKHHRQVLKERGYWKTYLKVDRPFTLTLRSCEGRGVPLDLDELDAITRRVSIDMTRLRTAFRAECGKPDINIQSKQQLMALFFDELDWPTRPDLVTETGAPQLNKAAYQWYINDFNFQLAKYMKEYNRLRTKKSTFLVGMKNGLLWGPGADENPPLLFSDLNQLGGGSTGRISSRKFSVIIATERTLKSGETKTTYKKVKAGMNLQNIPNPYNDEFKIRRVFVAPPGEMICVVDYSAFELWMALYNCHKLGIKSEMLKALLAGKDVHSMTAVAVCDLDCHWSEVKKFHPDKRNNEGKRSNFNLLYGGGAWMFANIMGWDTRDSEVMARAEHVVDTWMKLWPEMPKYQKRIIAFARKHGYVTTISGRRAHLKEGLSDPDKRVRNHYENKACNTPCQGSSADIMKVAMNMIERDEEMNELGYKQLFQVHDEIVGLCPEENAEAVLKRKSWLMIQPFKDVLPFPLVVEGNTGPNWASAK